MLTIWILISNGYANILQQMHSFACIRLISAGHFIDAANSMPPNAIRVQWKTTRAFSSGLVNLPQNLFGIELLSICSANKHIDIIDRISLIRLNWLCHLLVSVHFISAILHRAEDSIELIKIVSLRISGTIPLISISNRSWTSGTRKPELSGTRKPELSFNPNR